MIFKEERENKERENASLAEKQMGLTGNCLLKN
jgi:hypothetical protein